MKRMARIKEVTRYSANNNGKDLKRKVRCLVYVVACGLECSDMTRWNDRVRNAL